MLTTREQVATGAAWLDMVHPGWERAVDLGVLDMTNPIVCIIGQVFGGGRGEAWCNSGWDRLGQIIDLAGMELESCSWLCDHGFMGCGDHEWGRLIKDRFNSGQLSDEV
jgi:hypothetical protein